MLKSYRPQGRFIFRLLIVCASLTAVNLQAISSPSTVVTQKDTGFMTLVLETGQSAVLDTDVKLPVGVKPEDGYWMAAYGQIAETGGTYTAPDNVPIGSLDWLYYRSRADGGPGIEIRITIVPRGFASSVSVVSPLWDSLQVLTSRASAKNGIYGISGSKYVEIPTSSYGKHINVAIAVTPTQASRKGEEIYYICHRIGPMNPAPQLPPTSSADTSVTSQTLTVDPGWTETSVVTSWSTSDTIGKAIFDDTTIPLIQALYGLTLEPGERRIVGKTRSTYFLRAKYLDYYRASLNGKTWLFDHSTYATQKGIMQEFNPSYLSVFSAAPKSGEVMWFPIGAAVVRQDPDYK